MITYERLREIASYDPETGLFTSLVDRGGGGSQVGKILGAVNGNGYTAFWIDGTNYTAHRLAVLYMTGEKPEGEVDHKNRIRTDNKWDNLRQATKKQNSANRNLSKNNTSGYKGVSWKKNQSKWVTHVNVNGKKKQIGTFETKEEASKAYIDMMVKIHGEYATI